MIVASKIRAKDFDTHIPPARQIGLIGGVDDPEAARVEARKLAVEITAAMEDREIAVESLEAIYSAAVNVVVRNSDTPV